MREIKFRAKEAESGKFVYGDLHLLCKQPHIHMVGVKAVVKTDTIGQFTGMHDSAGRPIYEGDIVRSDLITPMEVYYESGTAMFMLRDRQTSWVVAIGELAGLEVIGNVYDNLDLLKGGGQ